MVAQAADAPMDPGPLDSSSSDLHFEIATSDPDSSNPDLPTPVVLTATLSESEQEDIRQLARICAVAGACHESDVVAMARLLQPRWSTETRRAVSLLRAGHPGTALLVRGMPLDVPLPPTPVSKAQARAVLPAVPVAMSGLAAISELFGFQIEYRQEKETGAGGYFMPVHPIRGAETGQTANSSLADLMYHTEHAFHPHRCRCICLLCLRPDHERRAATYFATARDIQGQLSPSTMEILRNPVFTTEQDESWGGGPVPGTTAVLAGSQEDPILTYDLELMRSWVPEAMSALAELGEAALAVRQQVVLEEGDLLLLDNARAVHGRSPFTARYDGSDRWLLRSYVASSLEPSTADRPGGGRLISTSFTPPAAA